MDSRFFLLPVAAFTIVQPAQATTYLSIEQAQALMFPGATLTEDFRTLSDAQVAMIEKAATRTLMSDSCAWKSSTGGWFIADQVVCKHDLSLRGRARQRRRRQGR